MVNCSLSTFWRYIPDNVVNPKPEDWEMTLCRICRNLEFKAEALKEPGVKLEWVLLLYDVQLKNWGDQQKKMINW